MSNIPFKKFIITFLLFNKDVPFIIGKLKSFGYYITEPEIVEILNELRSFFPSSLIELIDSKGIFNSQDELHAQWLKQLGVFEFYDYILRRDTDKKPPPYFEQCENCLWVHNHKDVMCIINILMFNDEKIEEISDIVFLKYKKKIGLDALNVYKNIFWDTDGISAKEAIERCLPFKDSALVVTKMRSGSSELVMGNEASNNGSDVSIMFHNIDYIKWKIGYEKIAVPTAKSFLEKVKKDSYFKYYEAMNMNRSIEIEEESGDNEKLGAFNRTLVIKKNVEDQRVKMAKGWMDMFLKANEALPEGGADTQDFFKKMSQVELDFEEIEDEKISRIQDVPEIYNDIKGDLSPC